MSSWAYGNPAPPILKAYVGDPSKIRLIHGGIKETHVFHLHNHQWRLDLDDPKSTIIDSILISPQECHTLDILYGTGSFNGMIGDAIFHCHLYSHFHEGMWTLWRIFDRLQDGRGIYPDGTLIDALMPLNDRPLPPAKDNLHPRYPNFINGTFGEHPLQPPLGNLTENGGNKIDHTPLEKENFVENVAPGALYTNICPCCTDENIKVFEIAAVRADLVYNHYGWHDPQGRFFVLREDIEHEGSLEDYIAKVEAGEICPEPLVIRENTGNCIEIRFTNITDCLEQLSLNPREHYIITAYIKLIKTITKMPLLPHPERRHSENSSYLLTTVFGFSIKTTGLSRQRSRILRVRKQVTRLPIMRTRAKKGTTTARSVFLIG